MRRIGGMFRRHGLALLLTTALVVVFFSETMPALREREELRARRAQVEAQLLRKQQALRAGHLWVRGAHEDPFVRERLLDARDLSPDVPGPRVLASPAEGVEQEP